MQEFTEKLIAQARGLSIDPDASDAPLNLPATALNSSMFGTRIGLWPLVSSGAPETSMGLLTLLAFLLERYQGVIVYRLFANVDDAEAFEWTMERSQFGVDDWQLDELDENVGIWGTLERNEDSWQLEIEAENDLAEDEEEPVIFSYRAKSLGELVNMLPKAAAEIASALEREEVKTIAPDYAATSAPDAALEMLLKQVFLWE